MQVLCGWWLVVLAPLLASVAYMFWYHHLTRWYGAKHQGYLAANLVWFGALIGAGLFSLLVLPKREWAGAFLALVERWCERLTTQIELALMLDGHGRF